MQVLTVFREPLIKSHAVALLAKCGGLNQRFLITQLHSIMSGVSLRKPCLSILARHLCRLKARRGRPHSNGDLTSYQRTDKRPLKLIIKG